MGKSNPSPPAAPDYEGAAVAQGAANVDAARASAKLSNPNIYGPYGSQTVTYDGDVPTVRQTLNPNAQAALDAQQRVQMDLSNLGAQGIDTAQSVLGQKFDPNLPGIKTNLGMFGEVPGAPNLQKSIDLSGVAKAPLNAGMTGQDAIMSRLAPQLQREDALLENRLRNQGLVPGGEAYNAEVQLQSQRANDLKTQAALQGIGLDTQARQAGFSEQMQQAQFGNQAGLTEQQAALQSQAQGYNQNLQQAQFGNTAQQQALSQRLALRNQPLNEITALMSGGQIQTPSFQGYQGQNVQAAPVFGAAQAGADAAMQNYGINQAGVNARNAGMYGLGSSGLMALGMFSDRRLKSNIVRVGTHPRGFGIYDYDIFGERKTGVMADEIEAIVPEAVMVHSSGFKMVNYGAL